MADENGQAGTHSPGEGAEHATAGGSGETPPSGARVDEEFSWREWTLVVTIAFAFFVVPGALLYLPSAQSVVESLGLTLRDAYLVLPLIPAFLLGAVAVWSAVRSKTE